MEPYSSARENYFLALWSWLDLNVLLENNVAILQREVRPSSGWQGDKWKKDGFSITSLSH